MVPLVQVVSAEPVTDVDLYPARNRTRTGQAPTAGIGDLLFVLGEPHRGPIVRKMVGRARDGDGAQTRSVEGEEPDPGTPMGVADIGPHVGLAEPAHPWHLFAA